MDAAQTESEGTDVVFLKTSPHGEKQHQPPVSQCVKDNNNVSGWTVGLTVATQYDRSFLRTLTVHSQPRFKRSHDHSAAAEQILHVCPDRSWRTNQKHPSTLTRWGHCQPSSVTRWERTHPPLCEYLRMKLHSGCPPWSDYVTPVYLRFMFNQAAPIKSKYSHTSSRWGCITNLKNC